MRHLKTLGCFLFIFISLIARSAATDSLPADGKRKVEQDIFINTTFFIKQIVSLSNSNLEISPYIVGYKVFPCKHHGVRFSIGGNFSSSTKFPDSSFVNIVKSYSIDYRVGYEYRHPFGKLWSFFAGFDITNSFSGLNSKSNSNTDIITTGDKTWSIGGGPVMGIQINIHKRIALFTETAFYYAYSKTNHHVTSLNFPELNINRISDEEHKGSFLLPTSIYFVFRF